MLEIELSEEMSNEGSQRLCDPCNVNGKETNSLRFCNECEEYLCEACTSDHAKQKATKLHRPTNIASTKLAKCEPCENEDKVVEAHSYCNTCEEYLCEDCVYVHKRMKATKTHDPKQVSSNKGTKDVVYATNHAEQTNTVNVEITEQTLVTQLEIPNESVDSPNNLSETIENDAEKRVEHQTENIGNQQHLDSCSKIKVDLQGKPLEDTSEHTAESQEPENENPTSLKGNTLHSEKYCDPCMAMKKKSNATCFCIDCDEYLCSDCADCHKAQKATRAHKLQSDLQRGAISGTAGNTATEKIIPGQPHALDVGLDNITLSWEIPNYLEKEDRFQVEYKVQDADNSGWQTFDIDPLEESTAILHCKPKTVYRFRVKCISKSKEWPYSLESEDITTPAALGTELVKFSRCISQGKPSPSRFELPATECLDARNPAARTRKFEVGTPGLYKDEKTVLLVGATGTGKSTLVDGLVNYVLGVDWNDPFRFVAVRLEDEEKQKRDNQAMSQTEWITTYSINPTRGTRIRYRLNIIDTPGFGDCRGLERDQQIVDQIRGLFSATGAKGILMLDAICFLIKAPDARLTPTQSYVFKSVMSLFGKDVEKNICSLITFADGDEPPVLAALKESKLPFGQYFTFNNSALFAKNTTTSSASLSKMFWQMGLQSYGDFFIQLEQYQPKSLNLTNNVLNERCRLEMTVKNLQPKVDIGLMKIDMLKNEINIVEQHKSQINDNQNFTYEKCVETLKMVKLSTGSYITNCITCNFTCHYPCGIPNDDNKRQCSAMASNGYCNICPGKCYWNKHMNARHRIDIIVVKEKKTYDEMRAKYKDAMGKLPTQEQLVTNILKEVDELVGTIEAMMEMVKDCNERLAEIALHPNPLTLTDHIDLMIENEKMERRQGFQQRIRSLNEFKKKAEVSKQANRFCTEAVSTFSAAGKTRGPTDIRSLMKSFETLFGFKRMS